MNPGVAFHPEQPATVILPSGDSVFVRPITPADEPLLQAFVKELAPDDARFRFFAPVHELSHAAAARFTRPDAVHDIVMLAFNDADRLHELVGVTQLYADAANRAAEFAIVVHSQWHAKGVGTALMRDLIRRAQARGIRTLWGDVLADNHQMLELCEDLKMSRTSSPLGASIIRVSRDLSVP